MSAEKWESVTWDWIEQEIVDYIMIASKEQGKAHALLNRLANGRKPITLSRKSADAPRRSTSNG